MKELEPYLNKITQGDCLEILKQLPDKCIDLVLTDPPYGIKADKGVGGFGSSGHKAKHYKGEWDNQTPSKEYFDEMLRVGKQVVIFGGQFFTDKLPPNGHWIVWDKKGDINFDNPFGDCELAWTNNVFKKSVKKYTVIQQGFISEERDRFHPTQKPVSLFMGIIRDYMLENSTPHWCENCDEARHSSIGCIYSGIVLDPFLGSGTTTVACKQLGRNFIGIEKEQNYCDIANERLSKMTGNLF